MLKTLVLLAARNTWRKRTRTLLTMGMVAAGVGLLVVGISWIEGIFGSTLTRATGYTGHVRVVDPDFAAREELMPLYENLTDVAALAELVSGQPGVVDVQPRITVGVTVTVGEEIGDTFAMVVGASQEYFERHAGVRESLINGLWFSGAPDEFVMGAGVAEQLGAEVGDEVVLLGVTQYGSLSPIKGQLRGIVRGGNGFVDSQVFVPLKKAQWMVDLPGGALELLVYASDYRNGVALAQQLEGLDGLKDYRVQAWNAREPWASMLGTVDAIRGVIGFIIVFLTALGIWNTMMMSVLERTHEIGVMRAMGLSRLGVLAMLLVEAVTIAVVGGLVGLALGAGPAWWLEAHGVTLGEKVVSNMGSQVPFSETMRGDLSAATLTWSFALGLATALLGGVVPALRAASITPVTAMRAGR